MLKSFIPVIAALSAFIVSWVSGYSAIPLLKRLKFGQTIREEGPAWHKSKEGTPTMGGILIVVGCILGIVLGMSFSGILGGSVSSEFKNSLSFTKLFAGIGLGLGMGLIGFMDDYIKVVKKRNLGLTAMQKTFFQSIVVVAYLCALVLSGMRTTYIPFVGEVDVLNGFGIVFWPIAFFFIYGFTNAVNLTDGLDGLASSVTLVVSCSFMLMSGYFTLEGANIISAALSGALVGFLVWNWYPAKIFMGDTGSMFLGGMVVAMSFNLNCPIILLLAGFVYLAEAISVILQVLYFKKTGKRLFKMSPIHHHFEKCGWSEVTIVTVFSLVTLIACGICVIIMR